MKKRTHYTPDTPIKAPAQTAGHLREDFRDLDHEESWILLLNGTNLLLAKKMITVGTIKSKQIDYRISKETLLCNDTAITLFHNHSGWNNANNYLSLIFEECCTIILEFTVMTIKRIRIYGLFGTFNHEIKFNNNVVIIMGENGVGKTITLKMIEAIFSKNLEYLIEKEFGEIVISFHKETWHIKRTSNINEKYQENELTIQSSRKNVEPFHVSDRVLTPRIPMFYERVGENKWFYKRNDYTRTLIERYGGDRPSLQYPDWYIHQCEQNRVKLIRTQRLYQEHNNEHQVLSVTKYSQELSALMQEEISKAAKNTGDLDRTFPKRLLRLMRSNRKFPSSEILSELNRLEKHRLELSDLGLLTEMEPNDAIINELNEDDNTMLSVLHLYVKDSWEKLKKYDKLYEKLSLLKDIINSRYKHKVFTFDSKEGFVIHPSSQPQGKIIPVEMLSSGEQNELVLFYEMLFKCDSKDLVLIDEPEISLHLEWMQAMIDDLIRISDKNKMSLLIATHSPDLVGENYELVQHLS